MARKVRGDFDHTHFLAHFERIFAAQNETVSYETVNRLRERLTNTAQLVPETWTLSRGSFILTMVIAMCNMLYSLSVALNCSWTLSVGPYLIDAQKCHLLHMVPFILTCVDHI